MVDLDQPVRIFDEAVHQLAHVDEAILVHTYIHKSAKGTALRGLRGRPLVFQFQGGSAYQSLKIKGVPHFPHLEWQYRKT